MASVLTNLIFNEEQIRDTSVHNGTTSNQIGFVLKTIIIENGLNQTASFQCQGSANEDFSKSFNVGSSFDVSASTNSYQTCDSYFPYFRVVATCSVSPTTGALTVYATGVN